MSVWKSGQSYKVSSKYLNWESLTLIMNYIPLRRIRQSNKIEAERYDRGKQIETT